jgi:hypothetical protein
MSIRELFFGRGVSDQAQNKGGNASGQSSVARESYEAGRAAEQARQQEEARRQQEANAKRK